MRVLLFILAMGLAVMGYPMDPAIKRDVIDHKLDLVRDAREVKELTKPQEEKIEEKLMRKEKEIGKGTSEKEMEKKEKEIEKRMERIAHHYDYYNYY